MTYTAPKRGFTSTEFENRVALAQVKLAQSGMDAMVLTTPTNFEYFSGFSSDFWESPTRPWFLIVPRSGDLTAVVPEIGAPAMAETIIKKIHTWPAPRPEDDGISLLNSVLANLSKRHGNIGWEMGAESTIRMPIVDFDRLRNNLSVFSFVDASKLIWGMRAIKSEAEIAHIAHACRIGSMSFNEMPDVLKLNDSENTASRKMRLALIKNGADKVPFVSACSGQQGYYQIIAGNGDKLIQDQSILFLDTGAVWDGYFCDFDRNFGFGHICDEAKYAYEIVNRAIDEALKAIRPNMSCQTLCQIIMKSLANGQPLQASNVGRLGHGLGMQLTEPPSLSLQDDTPLLPGMVMTIEPGFEYAPNKMIVLEENIVIRESGCELLTQRAPAALTIIQ